MDNWSMFLSYKHNLVSCQIYGEKKNKLYQSSVNCDISERDNRKLDSFRQGLQWLSLKGYKGALDVYLVGVYFEKWVTGVSVPPKSLLKSTFKAVKALDSCGFKVNFNQVSRVNRHGDAISKVEKESILDLMSNLEDSMEEEDD